MIDLGRETDGNNEICLGVHFALCIMDQTLCEHPGGLVGWAAK